MVDAGQLATVSTKFHDARFLSIADYHYIMAPRGLVLAEMVPPGWGLLEPGPGEIVEAPVKAIRKNTGIVSNVLRAIARANTTAMMRAYGVKFGSAGPVFSHSIDGAMSPDATPDTIESTPVDFATEEEHARNHH